MTTSPTVAAQTAVQVRAQVSFALGGGYAVELDNRFQFFPVDLYPSGLRSQIREEINLLGARVDDAWQAAAQRSQRSPVRWPDRDPDAAGERPVIAAGCAGRRIAQQRGVSDVRRAGGGFAPAPPPVAVPGGCGSPSATPTGNPRIRVVGLPPVTSGQVVRAFSVGAAIPDRDPAVAAFTGDGSAARRG